jgi:transposase
MANDTPAITVGLDLGTQWSHFAMLDRDGELSGNGKLRTTVRDFEELFKERERMRIVLEVGGQSPWISRLLNELGHEVIVANARRVQLIGKSRQKGDASDAETLARLVRIDVRLLHPVKHRGKAEHEALAVIRARAAAVSARSQLVNHVRGASRAAGQQLPACDTRYFGRVIPSKLDTGMRRAEMPLVGIVEIISETIASYDREVERMIRESYPEALRLQQVPGVGPLTSLTYILVLGDPSRFRRSRDVGAYLGLVPARRQSGARDPQLHITKAGDRYLRSLLVESANYLVSSRAKDSDLKRWAQARWQPGDRAEQQRTKVAVARKLAVLLHSMWKQGTDYRIAAPASEEGAA